MVLVVAAGVLGACSSSSTSGTTTTSTTHVVPVQNLAADQATATKQLLVLANFPTGWQQEGTVQTGTTSDSSTNNLFSTSQMPEFSQCLGVSPPLTVEAATATSPDFVGADQKSVASNDAAVYATAAEARVDFPPMTDAKFPDCFVELYGSGVADVVKSEFATGTTVGNPTARPASFPPYGDRSGMVTIEVPVTLPDGATFTDFVNLITILQGRSIAQLILDSSAVPFNGPLAESLAQTVTANMKANP